MAKQRRKSKGPMSWGLLVLGFIVGVASVMLFLYYRAPKAPAPVGKPSVPPSTAPRPPRPSPLPPQVVAPPPKMPSPPPPPLVRPSTLPRVAIVIDDMGQDMKRLDEIIGVGSQITIAVLPYLQYSTETAKEAHLRGLEVILHLPMEPKGSDEHDPGKGALWTAMTPAEVRGQTEADLKAVPYADGVNNHMGSRFTEDEPLMREVMGVVKKKGIYFLDSRTTSKSVGAKAARGLGAASAGRDVFLDNERDGKSIKARIDETVRIAKKRGTAIAIGHPYPETIKALHETLPGLDGKGVVVVRLSDLVK